MMVNTNIRNWFWVDFIATFSYLLNMYPSSSLGNYTLERDWNGRKPYVELLSMFGFETYMHIIKENMKKLDPKYVKCILFLYTNVLKGYMLCIPSRHWIVHSRDFIFKEDNFEYLGDNM
jgi:hypothetical protein